MRILHVLSTPRAEGTPNLVLDWLSAGTGHWQGVLVLNSQPADLTEPLRQAADEYEEHNLIFRGYRKFPLISRAAYKAVRRAKPDILICWVTGFANWVCLGARLGGVRNLLTHCGNPPRRGLRGDWITRYGMWPLAALGARCVCCSDYVRAAYQAVPAVPARIFHTVWNCTRGAQIASAAERGRGLRKGTIRRRAIMVATLEAHKDHVTLLRSIPSVCKRVSDFELWLVGEGQLRGTIESTIQSLGISEHVKLLGRRTDVGELLGQADLFVFSTTEQEGLGSVLLEALAAGLPVIATDVPACREVLQNGEFGTLVPQGDTVVLADQIVDGLLRGSRINAAGQAVALSLNPVRMMNAYFSLAADSN